MNEIDNLRLNIRNGKFHSNLGSGYKTLIGVCLKWRPLLFREGRTHFGNMKSFNQASSEFSSKTDLKVDESALAKLGLAFLGTNRNVGHLSWQTSAKVGRSGTIAGADCVSSFWAEDMGGGTLHCLECEATLEFATNCEQCGQMNRSCSNNHVCGTPPGNKPWACRDM